MQQLSMSFSSSTSNGDHIGECINCHDTFVKLDHNMCKYCHRAHVERCRLVAEHHHRTNTTIQYSQVTQ